MDARYIRNIALTFPDILQLFVRSARHLVTALIIITFVQTAHDRIAIEIMRGCPWQCRFCQSTVIKRPLRIRSVETIVAGALEMYRNTGIDEVSLRSLSSCLTSCVRKPAARVVRSCLTMHPRPCSWVRRQIPLAS